MMNSDGVVPNTILKCLFRPLKNCDLKYVPEVQYCLNTSRSLIVFLSTKIAFLIWESHIGQSTTSTFFFHFTTSTTLRVQDMYLKDLKQLHRIIKAKIYTQVKKLICWHTSAFFSVVKLITFVLGLQSAILETILLAAKKKTTGE